MKILRKKIGYTDFDQEDLHRFMTYGGRDLYDDPVFSSVGRGVKLSSLKRGKFKKSDIGNNVSIVFPANKKEYNSKGMFFVWDGKSKLDKYLDFVITIKDGLMIFSNSPSYLPLAGMLPKYNKDNSYNWEFFKLYYKNTDKPYPLPVITVPQTREGWENLLKALTEFLVFLRLFVGNEYRIYFHENEKLDINQKEFSDLNPITFIPTALNIGYSKVLAPYIDKQLHLKLHGKDKIYNVSFERRFKNYVDKTYKDLVLVKLGTGSCYINPRNIPEDAIEGMKNSEYIDKDRRRTMLDWVIWGYDNKKHIIFSNDLDNPLCLCHEVGHYLIDKSGGVRKYLQNHNKRGISNKTFIKFCGFILGLFGPIGEISGIISSLFLRIPLLYSEFMASYIGIDVLKASGGTEEEIEEAKEYFKYAYGTYLNSVLRGARFASYGRITGEAGKFAWGYRQLK